VDFDDTPQEAAFRAEARAWLEANAVPKGHPDDFSAGMWSTDYSEEEYVKRCREWQGVLAGGGWAGITWPVELGGRGGRPIEGAIFNQEQARFGVSNGVFAIAIGMVGPTLLAHGSEDQKRRFLPPMLKGDEVWCQLFSEPEAGSDLASLRTRAVRHGDEYVVTGQKIWSTRAHVADWCELLVRTDPEAPKHRGITWLILDMHQAGVEVRPMRTIDGEDHFCELFLDGARVPVSNRVGEEDDGWRVANVTLRFERGTAFAQHIITMRSQIRRLVALARSRHRDGVPAWDDPTLRRTVGRLDAQVDALWRMTQMCATEAERTGVPSPLGSAIKLRYSELAQEIAELGVRIVGRPVVAMADLDGLPAGSIGHQHLSALQFTIAAGTSQIQRNLVAERILGMPKG